MLHLPSKTCDNNSHTLNIHHQHAFEHFYKIIVAWSCILILHFAFRNESHAFVMAESHGDAMDITAAMKKLIVKDVPLASTKVAAKSTVVSSVAERLKRNGYKETVTKGQRRYHLPGVDVNNGSLNNCQIFCGRIPVHFTEDQLFHLFEKCGKVLDFQLMMDSHTDQNRGYVFVTYADAIQASECVLQLNNYKIERGTYLNVKLSTPNRRLFVGSIPKIKSKEMILAEFKRHLSGVDDVIVYSYPDDKCCLNRGFCFVQFETHQAAAKAKRRLESSHVRMWNNEMYVDWADPLEEPDELIMQMVKILYVRNLSNEVNEEQLRHAFEVFGRVERVKKMKNYAFVHFENRDCALAAMNAMNGKTLHDNCAIEITLSKPPSDKKKKEEVLRAREKRMLKSQTRRSRSLSNHNNSGDGQRGQRVMPEARPSISIFKNMNCWPQAAMRPGCQTVRCAASRPFYIS